ALSATPPTRRRYAALSLEMAASPWTSPSWSSDPWLGPVSLDFKLILDDRGFGVRLGRLHGDRDLYFAFAGRLDLEFLDVHADGHLTLCAIGDVVLSFELRRAFDLGF